MQFKAFVDGREHDVVVRPVEGGYRVEIDGDERVVDTARLESSFYSFIVRGRSYEVSVRELDDETVAVSHGGHMREVRVVDPLHAATAAARGSGDADVRAIMPGRIVELLVEEGETVQPGQGLLVLEAMKMENEVAAPRAGVVSGIAVAKGDAVETGAILVKISVPE